MHAILGQKKAQSQKFLEDGTRIPVTLVQVDGNPVVMVKTKDHDGYWSVQLGYGMRKNPNKATLGHITKAQIKNAPKFFKEVRFIDVDNADTLPKVGEIISAESVFKPGDIIDVTGVSKGKGFAGGVKRYHFKGGPRTHGQSDRERAPGSVGQTTTPGRVYRGKRMAGKMGFEKVTVRNLEVIDVQNGQLFVKGLVPGALNSLLYIEKKGENKKFVGFLRDEKESAKAEEVMEAQVQEEVKPEEVATPVEDIKPEVKTEEAQSEEQPVQSDAKTEAAVESEEKPAEEAKKEEVK